MVDSSIQTVTTPVPTDAQAPRLYQHAVYIQGGVVALCVIGIAVLLLFAPGVADIGVPVLGTVAGSAVNSLAGLLAPART